MLATMRLWTERTPIFMITGSETLRASSARDLPKCLDRQEWRFTLDHMVLGVPTSSAPCRGVVLLRVRGFRSRDALILCLLLVAVAAVGSALSWESCQSPTAGTNWTSVYLLEVRETTGAAQAA